MNKRDLFKSIIDKSITQIEIPNGVKKIGTYLFYNCLDLTEVIIPDSALSIEKNVFTLCYSLQNIVIGSNVSNIADGAFVGNSISNTLKSLTFKQPSGMVVNLPTPGDGTGMLYSKTANQMTIYTDNETIKNYDYATDNITATILHLDGSAWN